MAIFQDGGGYGFDGRNTRRVVHNICWQQMTGEKIAENDQVYNIECQ